MANLPISGLTASASNLASTDLAPVVQTVGVGPVKMTGLQLAGGLLGSTTFNGSTVTTSSPVLNLTQTWNAGAVTFTGLKFNATDTASASGSLLLDLQVGGTSRFKIAKDGALTSTSLYANAAGEIGTNVASNGYFIANNTIYGFIANKTAGNSFRLYTTHFGLAASMTLGWSNSTDGGVSGEQDTILRRAAAATLQLGAADTSASATVTITIATPGVVTWSSHGLSTGTPVIFSTTGALPTGITAGTTYYVIAVDANTFQIATSYANATAVSPTAVNTSGSQSGTHTGRRGAVDQVFRVQSASGTLDFPGADFAIQGSRGTGTGAGGSIIFQVAPAGSSGTAQNAYSTALTIDSTRLATFSNAIGLGAPGSVWRLIPSGTTSLVFWDTSNSDAFAVGPYNQGIAVTSAGSIGWSSSTAPSLASRDVILTRDAANTLALRNGGTSGSPVPQTFNVYNFYTDASNFERTQFAWSSNTFFFQTSQSGGTLRDISIGGNSIKFRTQVTSGFTEVWNFSSAGHFLASTDNTYDIGASGANRPRNVYVATSVRTDSFYTTSVAGFYYILNRFSLQSAADGTVYFTNAAGTDFNRLQFGGTTSSFPALKRSTTTLQVRLADDSAFGSFQTGGFSGGAPTIKTANYTQLEADYSLIFNGTGSITLTLLAAATYPGKILYVKTIAAQTVVSASSNVKPIDTDTAGTAILAATAGKWAMLQSDGTDWVIMAQG